jgi:hypothetical protein
MADLRSYGQVLYEAYVSDSGGKSVRDEKLPVWGDSAPEIRTHWEAAGEALRYRIMNDIAAGRNPADAG